ncbi:MAG: stage II sporulation protein M [Anaerolineae bacterium]|nr:stage II sporulation protein M [Anaerolineae bacterium]
MNAFVMTMQNALIITRREIRDSLRDWRIIGPIVILTFFFPFLAQWAAALVANFFTQYGAEFVGGQFIPFLLMVVGFFPISISLVIALETFVGEKERRSLEPLLSTPLTNTELYIGKTLAAMLPPLVASFGAMIFYLVTLAINNAEWQPSPVLTLQIFLLTIAQALVMVTGAVVVSSQTTSGRASNLLASFIIIPMTLIVNAESVIIFLAPDARSNTGITSLWAILAGMIIIVILLLRVGTSLFNREALLGRAIDSVNLRKTLASIWRHTRAVDDAGTVAANLRQWYTQAIPYTLRKLRGTLLVTLLVFIAFFVIGWIFGQQPQYKLPLTGEEFDLETIATQGIGGYSAAQAFGYILWQNTRVLLVGLLLSIFSFGVLAYVYVPIAFVVLGYLASQLIPAGYGMLFVAAVLPHGIVEIPVILLAAAAIFRAGAVITKPPQGETVGQVWSQALGDAIKIGLGIILPGLILAAVLESFITLRVVAAVASGLG